MIRNSPSPPPSRRSATPELVERPDSPSGLSLTGTSRLDGSRKVDKKIFKEVVKDCEALSDMLSGSLGDLALQSFSQKQQGQKEPYDAMLEEFKWLQSLPSQSISRIEDILPPGASGTSDKFKSDSMVGMILKGTTIDHVVPGGPAYHSSKLEVGDQILQVDGNPVKADDIDHFLSGKYDADDSEKPYVKMSLTIKKKVTGQQVVVPLWRNSATVIAERRFMFELLTFMKRTGVSGNPEVSQCIDKCTQHYSRVLEVEEGRQKSLLENIQYMSDKSTAEVERLRNKIQNLFQQQTEEVVLQKEKAREKDQYARKLDTRVTELMALLDSYKAEKEGLAAKLDAAEATAGRLRGENLALESQLKANEALVASAKELQRQLDEERMKNDDLLKKIAELQAKNDALQKENGRLQQLIPDLENKYNELLLKYNNLKDANKELQARNGELEKSVEQLKDTNMQLAGSVKDLERKNAELDDRYQQLLKKYQDLEDKHADLKDKFSALTAKQDQLLKTLEELERKNKKLQEQNTALEDELAELRKKLATLELQHGHLVKAHEKLEEGYDDEVKKNAELSDQNDRLSRQLSRMEEQLANKNAELEKLKEKLAALTDEHEKLKSVAALLQQSHDRLQTQFATLERDHAALRSSYDDLRKRCADLEQELDRIKASNQTLELANQKLEKKNSELQAQVDKVQAQNNELLKENNSLKHANQVLQEQNAALKQRCADAESKWKDLMAEYEQLKPKLTAALLENEDLRKQLAEAKAQCTVLTKEVEDTRRKFATMQAELEEVKRSYKRLQDQYSAVLKDLEALQTKCHTLTDENESLRLKYTDLDAKHTALVEELEDLRKKYAKLVGAVCEFWNLVEGKGPLTPAQRGQLERAVKSIPRPDTADDGRLKERCRECENALEASRKEASAHKLQASQLQQQLERLKQEVSRLEQLLGQEQSKAGVDNAELDAVMRRAQAEAKARRAAEMECESEGQKMVQVAARLEAAERENAQLRGHLTDVDKALEQQEGALADMVPRAQLVEAQRQQREAEEGGAALGREVEEKKKKVAEVQEQLRGLEGEVAALAEEMGRMVPREELGRAEAAGEEQRRLAEDMARRMAGAHKELEGLRRQVEASEAERARLTRLLQDAVPRKDFMECQSELQTALVLAEARKKELELLDHRSAEVGAEEHRLRQEVARLGAEELSLRQEVARLRGELESAQRAGGALRENAAAEEGILQRMAEELERSVAALEGAVPRMVPKGQLEAANTDVYKLRYALSDLRNLLGASVLKDPTAFKAICDALRGPGAVSPIEGARLLEKARNLPEGASRVLEAMHMPSTLSMDDSCAELAQLRENNVTPEQLHHVLRLLRQSNLLEQLSELEQLQREGTSIPEMAEKIKSLEQRLELRRQQACPAPLEHEEVVQLREEVVQLREELLSLSRRKPAPRPEAPAVRAAAPPPRPPSPPKPAGIGLLLERVDGEEDVHVKELTPGGAAERDGRIIKLDVILSVDGVDVNGMHLEKVFKLVLGQEGTKVTLQIQRTYAQSGRRAGEADVTTFFVSLTRQYMPNLDHELGHLEISPPRERPPGSSSRGRSPGGGRSSSPGPAQYTSLPRSMQLSSGSFGRMSPPPAHMSASMFASQPPRRSPSPVPRTSSTGSSMFASRPRTPNMDAFC